MEFVVNECQLKRALQEIEAAKTNGFNHCLAVMKLVKAGAMISDCEAEYSDLIERAHPTDGRYDWGRFQGVSRNNKFVEGKLIKLKDSDV